MSVLLANNAEGGTDGATVTYYNSGETSGDAWDYISIGAGATVTYSAQHSRGNLSYRFATGVSASQVMIEWEKFATPLSTLYVRFNVYLPTYPATSTRLCEVNDGTTTQLSIGIRSDGTLSVRDNVSAQMTQTTVPLPVGRWCRIEFRATSSLTTGQITLRTYREVDSPYPTETVSSAASFNTQSSGVAFNKPRFGLTGIPVANAVCFMDDIAVSSSDYLGPADASAKGSLIHRNGAESGMNGTVIDASNTGDVANAAFDLVRGSDPVVFSSTQAAHGSLSYRILPSAGQESFITWTRAATSAMAARFYVYFAGFPGSLEEFAQLSTSDAVTFTALARFAFTPTNNLRVIDSSGTALWTSTTAMTANTWYRFEIYGALGGSATTGRIRAAYFALDSTTPIDSFSTSAANLGMTSFGYLRLGKIGSTSAWNTAMYIDDIAQQQRASGFIGPYTARLPAFGNYTGAAPPNGWGIPAQLSKIDPIPIFNETFPGSNGSAWDSSKWVVAMNPVTGGSATIQSNAGRLQSGTTGNYSPDDRIIRRINIGQVADFDMTCTFSYDATESFGTFLYRSSRTDMEVENCYAFEFTRGDTLQFTKYVSFAITPITTVSYTLANNTLYKTRIRVIGNSHSVKIWAATASEPTSWNMSVTDSSHQNAGNLGFYCAGGVSAGVAGNFFVDDVTFVNP